MLELFRKLLHLPPAASSFARGVDGLHVFVIVTTFLGVGVIGAITTYFVVRWRERAPGAATPRVAVSVGRESALVVGTLALFFLWWVIGYRQYLEMRRRPANAIPVYVIAKQWMWKFSYADGRIANDVLTVPLGRPVELIMTSRDVIHSFFVPAMRVKQDVLPGRYVTLWFQPIKAGTYPLFCAEYCGVSHSKMLGEVQVLDDASYRRWQQDATQSTSLAAFGRDAAVRHACLSCHTIDGQPHIGPTWSRLYGSPVKLADGREVVADPAYLTESMMDPAAEIVAGYPAVMPTYLGSLDTAETAAIVEYIRSLQAGPVTASVALPRLAVSVSPPGVAQPPPAGAAP
jgi:cytochrome c oxidase subunit 2